MTLRSRSRTVRILLFAVAGLAFMCLLALAVLAFVNSRRPVQSSVLDRLGEPEKARLAEAFHIRQALGDAVWPGWGEARIPAVLYNEQYAFLVGYPGTPPDGWVKVPQDTHYGGEWEPVPGDTFGGQAYYRQRLPGSGVTPEAFAVLIGDQWSSSLPTMEWLRLSMAEQMEAGLPPVLGRFVPYQLITGLFVPSSDFYIAAVSHEAFHAFEGMMAPERLAEAEQATRLEATYPYENVAFQEAWQAELDLLTRALQATSPEETAELARDFLNSRRARRQDFELPDSQVDLERQREWLEGLSKYVELAIWRQAATTPDYAPLPALLEDPEFEGYAGYEKRWDQEVKQIGRMSDDDGDGRFYYSGMAQATLLDRLMPEWKSMAMGERIFLETLLERVLSQETSN